MTGLEWAAGKAACDGTRGAIGGEPAVPLGVVKAQA